MLSPDPTPSDRVRESRTATEYASSVEVGGKDCSWTALELSAFSRTSAAIPLREMSAALRSRQRARSAVLGAWLLVVEFFPLIALLVMLSAARLDLDINILVRIAAPLVLVYIVVQPRYWLAVLAHREAVVPRLWLLSILNVVFGATGVYVVGLYARVLDLDGIWMAVMIASAATSVATVVIVRSAVARGAPLFFVPTPYDVARAAVDALPVAERQAIRADVNAALTILVDAGVIDPDAAAEARGVQLGGLARWAWAREQQARAAADRRRRRS